MDKNTKIDKMQYQSNSIGYLLVLLAMIVSLVALFTLITYDSFGSGPTPMRVIPDFRIGIEIGIGILMLLFLFLTGEKVKFYDKTWSYYIVFILAGVNFIRIFNIPLYEYNLGWIPQSTMIYAIVEFALAGVLLVIAGIISARKVYQLNKYLKEKNAHGNNDL